ncbi:hypothetical protein SAMN00017477_1816 [Peptoniphilus asaccharolyticus DSM 20463]|uniref:Iron (Metal) dependent repressor, DtxR family n=1 Tax=Peptoniphilus asaccharolyticus DSM 20463 TaxID=573058 RepID=A0A1W1VE24_PEPAS|nr:MarR family winged helix-turn-helix transcriptional regulator [Peptoniphilus asaccharolyticus]SMB91575.1 hypothetical protein SAMN00017477_1816 [Peptoniphilus asaccharolyticus DSM 20463]
MGNLEITNIQKLYLLHLKNNEKDNNITAVAKAFSCTKPNSKNILDNMIREGFLYKEENKYRLTKIGEKYANELDENRSELELFLSQGLKICQEESEKISYALLSASLDDLSKKLISKSKKLGQFKNNKKINYEDLVNVFGDGEYRAMLSIEKYKSDDKESFNPLSMAMMGFEEEGRLLISHEAYIVLESKVIKRPIHGYTKSGIVTELFYITNGEEHVIEYNNKKFYIPISIFKEWHLMGGHILKSSINLNISSKIGISKTHKEKADFIIILDLLNLEIC